MSWSRTRSHRLALPPDAVWAVLSHPTLAPQWQRAIQSLEPRAGLAEGAELDFRPSSRIVGPIHARTAPPARLVRLEPGRRFAWRQPQPGGGMLVQWDAEADDGGTRVTQRVVVDGPAAPVFARSAGAPLAADFAGACARLFSLAGGTPTAELKVVIAGAPGPCADLLAAELHCSGHDVAVLTRHPTGDTPYREVPWSGTPGPWEQELDGTHGPVAVVHLAHDPASPEPPDAPPSAWEALAKATRRRPVARWIDIVGAGGGDLGAGAHAARRLLLRSGLVLRDDPRLLARMARSVRAAPGGGDGGWLLWIHAQDWLRVVRAALGLDPEVALPDGDLLAAAPEAVRPAELPGLLQPHPSAAPLRAARTHLPGGFRGGPAESRPARPQAPAPTRLQDAGFGFLHPQLAEALAAIRA